MSRLIVFIFIGIITIITAKAQSDTVFMNTGPKIGLIELNAQNAYFSSFRLLVNEKPERIRLDNVDSVILNSFHYGTLDFYIGKNAFKALAKRYFQGEYSLFVTWSDQYGELHLKQMNDTVIVITDQNKTALFDFTKSSLTPENLKISSRSLIKLSTEIHENNNYTFSTNRAQKGKGIIRNVLIGGRFSSYTRDWTESFNDAQYNDKFSDNSIDIFMRIEGKRMFFEPVFRLINTTYTIDSISFEESPSLSIVQKMSGVVLGTDLGFYILKNPYFRPFVKAGLSFPLTTNFDYEITSADPSIDNLRYQNQFVSLTYAASVGAGVQLKYKRLSAIISYSTQKLTASTEGEVRYDKTFFPGTLSEFVGPRGETILGEFSDKSGRFEVALAFTFLRK